MALPPRFITSTPTREASSLVEATIAWRARTGSREAALTGRGVVTAVSRTRNRRKARFAIISYLRFEVYQSINEGPMKSEIIAASPR
jgi:hypothetical protein